MEVIYIIWKRQLKRYFRSKSRMIGSLGQPVLFMVAFGFGFGPMYSQAGGGNYIEFLIPGVIAMTVLFTAIFSGFEIIWDRQFGFLKEMLVAPVSRLQIMAGRSLGGATVAVFQGLMVMLLSFAIGFRVYNLQAFFFAILFMFLIAFLFSLFGTAIASVMKDMQGFNLIMNFLVMPIFFLSGAFFPLDTLPKAMYRVVQANPLSYGVDALRGVLVNMSHFGLMKDALMLSAWIIALLFISSYLFSKIEA